MPDLTPHEAQLAELTAQLARVLGERDRALQEVKLLRQKLDALARRLFGKSSEQLDPGQLLLLLQGFDESPKVPEPVEARPPSILPFPFRLLGGGPTALDGPIASA